VFEPPSPHGSQHLLTYYLEDFGCLAITIYLVILRILGFQIDPHLYSRKMKHQIPSDQILQHLGWC